jgi:hypothetical protein
MKCKIAIITLAALTILVAFTGCRKEAPTTPSGPTTQVTGPTGGAATEGADRPQAVFSALIAASKKNDHRAIIDCFSPEAQKAKAAGIGLYAIVDQAGAQAEDRKDFREQCALVLAALDKHGLSYDVTKKFAPVLGDPKKWKQVQQDLQGMMKDPAGLYVDLAIAYDKSPSLGSKTYLMVDGTLTDVKVDGEKAKGTLVVKLGGQEVKGPADFVKIGGKWKIAPVPEGQ